MSRLENWFYASNSLVKPSELARVTSDIVAVSVPRNLQLSVTGALIATGAHFAQYLEGPPDAIAALRLSICADRRHSDVWTIDQGPVDGRFFAQWSLAYSGEVPEFEDLILKCREMQPSSANNLLTEVVLRFSAAMSGSSATKH